MPSRRRCAAQFTFRFEAVKAPKTPSWRKWKSCVSQGCGKAEGLEQPERLERGTEGCTVRRVFLEPAAIDRSVVSEHRGANDAVKPEWRIQTHTHRERGRGLSGPLARSWRERNPLRTLTRREDRGPPTQPGCSPSSTSSAELLTRVAVSPGS